MPRHVHRPVKQTKNSKLFLEDMQEARKEILETKKDLLEHNQALIIHSHEDENSASFASSSETTDYSGNSSHTLSKNPGNAGKSGVSVDEEQAGNEMFFPFMVSSDQMANGLQQWFQIQAEFTDMVCESWLAFFRIGNNEHRS